MKIADAIKKIKTEKRLKDLERFMSQYKTLFDEYLTNAETDETGFVIDPILRTVFTRLFHSMPENEQDYFHDTFEDNIHTLVIDDYDEY